MNSEQLILSKNLKTFNRIFGRKINRGKPRARNNHSLVSLFQTELLKTGKTTDPFLNFFVSSVMAQTHASSGHWKTWMKTNLWMWNLGAPRYSVRSEYKRIWSEYLFASKRINFRFTSLRRLYSLVSHQSESADFTYEMNKNGANITF